MAIIRTFRTGLPNAAVIEDPIPGSPNMFFQLDAVNKSTLTPLFDTQIQFSMNGLAGATATGAWTDDQRSYNLNNFGSPILSTPPVGSGSGATGSARSTGVLILNGEVTHCRHFLFNTANDYRNTIDFTPMYSMDPTRVPRQASFFTDGTNNVVYFVYYEKGSDVTSSFVQSTSYVLSVNTTSSNLVNSNYMLTNDWINRTSLVNSYALKGYPMYRNPSTGNMVWHGTWAYMAASNYGYPSYQPGLTTGSAFSVQTTSNSPTAGSLQYYTSQWIGVSAVDGFAITLANFNQNDHTTQIWKYNDGNNTATNLSNISTVPTASGSSVGGNRGTNFGSFKNKYCSRWFTDPLTANSRGFYMPYVDTNGNWAPFYWQWNTTTDVFTRNANCTVNWGGGNTQATFWIHDGTLAANADANGLQTVWYNETFNVGSNRYLLFMQLNGAGGLMDSLPRACTFVNFSVNAADPRILTYHSRMTIPATPKNIVWLSDDRTVLGVFTHTAFYIYTFTEANGWTQTANLPFQFSAVGRDNLGRIWAVDPGPNQWGRVHLITLTVPVTIVVTPDATTYTYSGTPINANVAVRALDANGNRISTSVKLVIDGGSMLFGGNNFTTTVTTSASADVNVAVSITGGGVSNIIASVPV